LLLIGILSVISLFLLLSDFPGSLSPSGYVNKQSGGSDEEENSSPVVEQQLSLSDVPLKIIRIGVDKDAENFTVRGLGASQRKVNHDLGVSCTLKHRYTT
jgi:hypothetical protein